MNLGSLKNFDPSLQIISGADQATILGISDNRALAEGHLIFVKNKNYLNEWLEKSSTEKAQKTKTTGLIIEKKFFDLVDEETKNIVSEKALFVATVENVNIAISIFSKPFYDEKFPSPNDIVDGRQMGSSVVDSTAWIAQGVFVGENVIVGANVKIHSGVVLMSGVQVHEGTEIFSNTVIYRNVKIGKNVRIHSNCSIGADGFGYNFKNGEHLKVWHMGSVIIHDNVEIGANTCVDSGTFSPTSIGQGTKIDNLVQIGHNCRLGRGVIVCGMTAIAGSCKIEDFVVIGGQVAIADGITIGTGAQIAGNSGVTGNVEAGEVIGGYPARNIKEWMKGVAYVRKHSLSK